MKVISIATQKGGVGKTTSSMEIASALNIEHEKKVLLIDFDQQGNLSKYVGVNDNKNNIYNALHDSKIIKECIRTLEFFDFIPSSPELSKSDIEFNNSEDVFLLDDALDLIKENYDYIIIDNGPQRNKLLQMAYVASDYIIAPCDDTEGGSDGLINVYNDVEKMKNARMQLSNAEIIGVIITRYKGQTTLNKVAVDILNSVMNKINPKGFVLPVRDSIKVSEAKYKRTSVQKYATYNNAAIDYRKITQTLIDYEKGE